ncbi:tetratricopeptide repeat protein [archaeon]|nr:tetratricopeptide repeat protein [archaeon]
MVTVLEREETVHCAESLLFDDLQNPKKYSSYFKNTFLSITGTEQIPAYFQFIATISTTEEPSNTKESSRINGNIRSVTPDDDFQELGFEWTLTPIGADKTELHYRVYRESDPVISSPVINNPLYDVKTMSLIGSSAAGIAAMAIIPATTIVSSTAGIGGILISKSILMAIIISVAAVMGVGFIGDSYYSDPNVEYSLHPEQMPADLHGASLYVQDVRSTDDKSEIVSYECDNESTIHDLNYSFECITTNSLGNKESVITDVSVRGPNNRLGDDATQCVEQYYVSTDGISRDYPYLSGLPDLSQSRLSDYKNTHVKIMDDYFAAHDYEGAKRHATIVLKYFNVNDLQALSTLGNVMRDEDRTDANGVNCAVTVHGTPFVANTAWGKLSLAEDHHVLGDYDESVRWSSQVIVKYNTQTDDDIHETSYANALVVKANALYRQAVVEHGGNFDEAKRHYNMAHDITPSYDTWFGLGNIDRQEGNFADALEKYEEAKKMTDGDSTEIDEAIISIS